MGRVLTEARFDNLTDLLAAEHGSLSEDQVRSITIPSALVDSGATLLSLPTSLIGQLGLAHVGTRQILSGGVRKEAGMYEAVRLTIQGRSCTMDVLGVPDGIPVVIGRTVLLQLDLVMDEQQHTLIGNPAHGGEHVNEMF